MKIKEKAKILPSSPGVYLMKDSSGHIIYVGKSKNLKNRVQSYLIQSKNHTNKVVKLVNHLKDFDFVLTDTEFEAFMLECKLIKEFKPIYNKMMKTPKSYTYIKIRLDSHLKSIGLSNSINEYDSNLYFGPYSSMRTIEKAIQGFKEFYNFDCNNPTNKHTPCLNYTLGKCIGICFDDSAVDQYNHIINRFIAFLNGEDTGILDEIEQKMMDASINFEFELATKIREWIKVIKSLYKKGKVIEFAKENKNIVVMEFIDNNRMKLFLIRRNVILFKQMYKINNVNLSELGLLIRTNFNDVPQSPMDISKDEIDEAQIIYRYLNSNDCKYLIIPEKWLSVENQDRIENALNEMLKPNV